MRQQLRLTFLCLLLTREERFSRISFQEGRIRLFSHSAPVPPLSLFPSRGGQECTRHLSHSNHLVQCSQNRCTEAPEKCPNPAALPTLVGPLAFPLSFSSAPFITPGTSSATTLFLFCSSVGPCPCAPSPSSRDAVERLVPGALLRQLAPLEARVVHEHPAALLLPLLPPRTL